MSEIIHESLTEEDHITPLRVKLAELRMLAQAYPQVLTHQYALDMHQIGLTLRSLELSVAVTQEVQSYNNILSGVIDDLRTGILPASEARTEAAVAESMIALITLPAQVKLDTLHQEIKVITSQEFYSFFRTYAPADITQSVDDFATSGHTHGAALMTARHRELGLA